MGTGMRMVVGCERQRVDHQRPGCDAWRRIRSVCYVDSSFVYYSFTFGSGAKQSRFEVAVACEFLCLPSSLSCFVYTFAVTAEPPAFSI